MKLLTLSSALFLSLSQVFATDGRLRDDGYDLNQGCSTSGAAAGAAGAVEAQVSQEGAFTIGDFSPEIIGTIATYLFTTESEERDSATGSAADVPASKFIPGTAGFYNDIRKLLLLGVRLNKPNIREGVNFYVKVPVHLALEGNFHRMGLRHMVVDGISHKLPALQDEQQLSGVLRIFEGQASRAEAAQYLNQHKDLSLEYIGSGTGVNAGAGAAGAAADSAVDNISHERLREVSLESFWQSNQDLGNAIRAIPYSKHLGVRNSILPFLGNPIMSSILRKVGRRNFIHFSEAFSDLSIKERMSV